ncbi:EAL domain-containing protein [Pseudoxanthomonas mexicana]|uniref:bifunctional diguanylate cyclase/phosphodiesterase n=1 Tax=Pseudoxanthomonas mexicana TaxID=128785 RepID=UPI00398AA4AF
MDPQVETGKPPPDPRRGASAVWRTLRPPRISPLLWAATVMLAGTLITGWIALGEWRDQQRQREQARQALADTVPERLHAPLRQASDVLRAMQTVFLSNDRIDARQFEQFHHNLRSPLPRPLYSSLAYAPRRGGDASTAVSYRYALVAPRAGNSGLLGFDMVLQPANLRALRQARDTDTVVMSAPFDLSPNTPAGMDPLGITVRLPVYSNGPMPDSVQARREREIGALAMGLRLQPLIARALDGAVLDTFRVRVRDAAADDDASFYDSGAEVEAATASYPRELAFGGRRWVIELVPRPHPLDTTALKIIVAVGLTISLLLALLLWSLATTRLRAVTLGRQMGQRYRDSKARFRALNELLPALVLLARGPAGTISYANQAARRHLGDVAGQPLAALFADPQLRQRLIAEEETGGEWTNLEAMMHSPGRHAFWANTSIARIVLAGEPHLLMVATDMSEQRELTERLSYQASHDALTELFNRGEFERRVEQALSQRSADSPPCALLYIDLDQFKLINDVSGHMAGDQLLAQLALAMRQQLREGDILARLGGDEFGLMAFRIDAQGACALAERLRTCIEALMFAWQDRTYTISASIGVVTIDHGEPSLKDVLAWADTACYQAKENGRNRVHLYRQDQETTRRHGEMEWANRLRWAIEQDRMLLDYQRILSLDGRGGDSGIELLLRLRDEDGGIVPPGTFLPAAERYGLMPTLDRWVIRTALANFPRLHAEGQRPACVAINLSGASIEDEDLADFILACIDDYGVSPDKLCFEITETVAVRNLLKVVGVIGRLRGAGCRIALDDFGAGMSSFGYLKNLPVDLIKIDGSFIRDLDSAPMSRTIVSAIAEIGHQLGLKVVAEWVGDRHTADLLHTLGVDYGQGFGLHRPERVQFQRMEHAPLQPLPR